MASINSLESRVSRLSISSSEYTIKELKEEWDYEVIEITSQELIDKFLK